MSRKEPPFSEADLAAIAKCIDSAATHTELDSLLRDVGLVEPSERSGLSKWQSIYNALANAQSSTATGNFAMRLIQTVLSPKRFVQRATEFDGARANVNQFLAFRGWHLFENGKFGRVAQAATIEAKVRASRIRSELERRDVHSDVLVFCRAELLQENYFHAVLEATKSVAEKIRAKTGLTSDAGELATISEHWNE
jgi:hypothetical protein